MCQSPLDWPPKLSAPPLPSEQTLVAVDWLAERSAGSAAVALDVRDEPAFRRGHIPGAVLAHGVEPKPVELGIAPGQTVVLYGRDGKAEAVAAHYWRWRRAGLDVRVLAGGLGAWLASGRELARGGPVPMPARLPPRPTAEVTVDADELLALLGGPGVALLDVRDARGWERWEIPPTFARGHVPHALPFDVAGLLAPDGAPASLEQVRERVLRHGPRKGDPIAPDSTYIVYGQDADDPQAAIAYLLLDAAGFRVRIFAGGFTEWAAASRPVMRVVEPAEVRSLVESRGPGGKVNVLDLRDERAFAVGHLPGAKNVPGYDFEREVNAAFAGLERNAPLVLYCYGPGCVRSWNAGPLAARQGFRDILWLRGGTEAWERAGYPLVESPLPRSGQSLRKQNHWWG